MMVRAKRMTRNFSTAENWMASLARGGVKSQRQTRLNIPPSREAVMPILRARSPSPFRVMG